MAVRSISRVYIVEDEPLIKENIRVCLEESGYIVCGFANNAADALVDFERIVIDVVLIDICLKGTMDGITLAEEFSRKKDIPFIYLTSYSDAMTLERAKHTLPAGYIVKPFDEADLRTSIEIALARHQNIVPKLEMESTEHIFVKQNGEFKSVEISEIEYVQAYDNYSFIHLAKEKILIRITLKKLQNYLPEKMFIRCHRTYIVNIRKICSVSGANARIGETRIPISKNYRKHLLDHLFIVSEKMDNFRDKA